MTYFLNFRGESSSLCTKDDRLLDAYEYNLDCKNIIGRKIDLLLIGFINVDDNERKLNCPLLK